MKIEDSYCSKCNTESVYLDLKEEPAIYKVGAVCTECSHDYGVIDRVPVADIERIDEVLEIGERSLKQLLETTE